LGSGGNRTTRNSPSIINLAWSDRFFWDGRVDSLEKQVIFPIESHLELNLKMEELVQRLKAETEYVKKFNEVFPQVGITKETIASALATFVRTLKSHGAPFDKWIKGDANAINESAKRGFDLFRGKAKCISCHFGWRFTNDQFADIGVVGNDIGRGKFDSNFNFAFKIPGLRKISETSPYMHNGSLVTLDDVIEFFNRGGDVKRPSVQITPLHLTSDEKKDLKEFLLTLTDKEIRKEILQELYSAKEIRRKKRNEEFGY
jgi:cytochrome c peroxidase